MDEFKRASQRRCYCDIDKSNNSQRRARFRRETERYYAAYLEEIMRPIPGSETERRADNGEYIEIVIRTNGQKESPH
jgi:hypothetical protein